MVAVVPVRPAFEEPLTGGLGVRGGTSCSSFISLRCLRPDSLALHHQAERKREGEREAVKAEQRDRPNGPLSSAHAHRVVSSKKIGWQIDIRSKIPTEPCKRLIAEFLLEPAIPSGRDLLRELPIVEPRKWATPCSTSVVSVAGEIPHGWEKWCRNYWDMDAVP